MVRQIVHLHIRQKCGEFGVQFPVKTCVNVAVKSPANGSKFFPTTLASNFATLSSNFTVMARQCRGKVSGKFDASVKTHLTLISCNAARSRQTVTANCRVKSRGKFDACF
jgi:hypothetical protein